MYFVFKCSWYLKILKETSSPYLKYSELCDGCDGGVNTVTVKGQEFPQHVCIILHSRSASQEPTFAMSVIVLALSMSLR